MSGRDKVLASYIEILDSVESLLSRLKSFEVPDREQRTYGFLLPTMTHTECPDSLKGQLSLDRPLGLEITLTHEVQSEDVRSENTPQELNAFYGVSLGVSDETKTVMISRDRSVNPDIPASPKDLVDPPADVTVPTHGKPWEIPRVDHADLQRIVLFAIGYTHEDLRRVHMEQTDMFAPEKRMKLEAILHEYSLTNRRTVEYQFPEDNAYIAATYEAFSDKKGVVSERLQTFTVSFGNPKHVATVSLAKGLDVDVAVGDITSPDAGEIIKFVEALDTVAQSIESRRPRVVTASPAEIEDLEQEAPITLL